MSESHYADARLPPHAQSPAQSPPREYAAYGHGDNDSQPLHLPPLDKQHESPKLLDDYYSAKLSLDERAGAAAYAQRERSRNWKIGCVACCALLLVLIAVIVPVVIYVAVPRFAQSAIDGSTMKFDYSMITDARNDSFKLYAQGSVSDAGPLDAHISFPAPVQIFWRDTLLAEMDMDPLESKGFSGAKIESVMPVRVLDQDAMLRFNRFMMESGEFEWHLKGRSAVTAMGMEFGGLALDKRVKMKGFNKFQEINIDSFDLPENDPVSGIKTVIQTRLVNPSPIGIELGNVVFNMYTGDTLLGQVSSPGVSIKPGENAMKLSGRLTPIRSGGDAEQLSKLFSMYLSGTDSTVKVVGVSVNADSEPVPWLDGAFRGFEMTAPFPGAKKTKLIQGINLESMEMAFSKDTPYAPLMSSKGVVAKFAMPFDFPLQVLSVQQNIDVSVRGEKIARITTPWSAASGNSEIKEMTTDISGVAFDVYPGKEAAFQNFLVETTFSSGSVATAMSGTASAMFDSAIGKFRVNNLPFSDTIQLKGIQGLQAVPPKINSMRVVGGTPIEIIMHIDAEMFNPSNIVMKMGRVVFLLKYAGETIGTAVTENCELQQGKNDVKVVAHFSPQGAKAHAKARVLLERHSMGGDEQVGLVGFEGTTEVASVAPALSRINLVSVLPGLRVPLIERTRFTINFLTTLFNKRGFAGMDSRNPFDAPISILRIDASMLHSKLQKPIGTMSQDLAANPIVMAPQATARSPPLDLRISISAAAIQSLFQGATGSLLLDVKADMLIRIGDYETELHYEQQNVHCDFQKP